MKKLSTTFGSIVMLAMGDLYCLSRSDESVFLYGMIGIALILAGAIYYVVVQIDQLMQIRMAKLDELNMQQNMGLSSSLTGFIDACGDNNRQILQNLEQLKNHESEIMTDMKNDQIMFLSEVKVEQNKFLSDLKTGQQQHQNELEKSIKDALFEMNQVVANMKNTVTSSVEAWIESQKGFVEEARNNRQEISSILKSMMEQSKKVLEQSLEIFNKQMAGHREAMDSHEIESHAKMERILEANKQATVEISDFLSKQEVLMEKNNKELIAANLNNQEELSAKLEESFKETRSMIEDLAELLGGYSGDYTKANSQLLGKIAADLQSRHEDSIGDIISENKKQLKEVMNGYESYIKEIRSNAEELKKLVADIGNAQVNLIRNLDERQESYRQMNAEDIQIMKDIMK